MINAERETTVNIAHADDYAEIYSTESRFWRLCEKAGWLKVHQDAYGRIYKGPKEALRISVRSETQMARQRELGRASVSRLTKAGRSGRE